MSKLYLLIIPLAIGIISGMFLAFYTESESEPSLLTITKLIDGGSPIMGNSNAPITILEWGDYQCTFCYKFHQNTLNIIQKDFINTGKVKLVFKDFPLNGPDSLLAAEATYCAEDQEKYWEYHSTLYSNQLGVDNGWANTANLKKYASNLGLDMDLFANCLDSGKYLQRVLKNTDVSRNVGFSGVTAFMIIGPNNQQDLIIGAQPYEVFKKVIEPMF